MEGGDVDESSATFLPPIPFTSLWSSGLREPLTSRLIRVVGTRSSVQIISRCGEMFTCRYRRIPLARGVGGASNHPSFPHTTITHDVWGLCFSPEKPAYYENHTHTYRTLTNHYMTLIFPLAQYPHTKFVVANDITNPQERGSSPGMKNGTSGTRK